MSTRFCPKCKKTMDEGGFYTHKDSQKTEQCKKCMTMHIDNKNPETFLWLLEKMDVPYIKEEWDTLYERAYAKDPYKITGMSVFGKYLSKMKLKQWQGYSWEDTDRLRAEKDMKMQGAIASGQVQSADFLKEKFEAGEITEAEYLTLSEEPEVGPPASQYYPTNNPYPVVDTPDIALDLTDEDMIFLAMKWGRLYRPDQWVQLEKMWTEMHDSFDIQGAVREDQCIKICKTSLKMDEALDCGDVDTYQKLTRMYDVLTKAGKFTEAQNKEQDKGFVNSVGELVGICEKEEGFIPKYITDVPQDKVDITLNDFKRYVHNLITKDLSINQQLEDAIKKVQIQKDIEQEEEELNTGDFDDIVDSGLNDADFEEFFGEIENQRQYDLEGDEDNGS